MVNGDGTSNTATICQELNFNEMKYLINRNEKREKRYKL